jgi:hypothetical protein
MNQTSRYLLLSLVPLIISSSLTSSPTLTPTSLSPTQTLAPFISPQTRTLVPTFSDVHGNDAVRFRIQSLSIFFSSAGFLFLAIIGYRTFSYLIEKAYDEDDLSRWEMQKQQEYHQQHQREIETGIRKPEGSSQWSDDWMEDQDCKFLEVSWVREKDFAMQYEDPDTAPLLPTDRLLTVTTSQYRGSSSPQTPNQNSIKKNVKRKQKKAISSYDVGAKVIVLRNGNSTSGNVVSIDENDYYTIQYTGGEVESVKGSSLTSVVESSQKSDGVKINRQSEHNNNIPTRNPIIPPLGLKVNSSMSRIAPL